MTTEEIRESTIEWIKENEEEFKQQNFNTKIVATGTMLQDLFVNLHYDSELKKFISVHYYDSDDNRIDVELN